uniref:Uncharacterized protein n=1 Tax=Arundo donax TaxID=35708 RepID=A0A0A9FWN9_ARUDO
MTYFPAKEFNTMHDMAYNQQTSCKPNSPSP